MSHALNWLWLLASSACVIVGMGVIARVYWWLFMVGWGLL
jgi:hypothetical protein